MNILELYEKKTLSDEEFPVEVQDHSVLMKAWSFSRHWHEHLELHYVVSGEAVFWVEQQQYVAKSGTLIIANKNELHSGKYEKIPLEERTFIFRMDAFSKELDEQNLVFCNAIVGDWQIERYVEGIWQELQQRQQGYKASCRALLTQLLVYLRRNYVVQTLTNEETRRKKRELERMHKVISYIEKHYPEPIDNQKLADLIYLSKGRFEHLFREIIGISPVQYVNEFRLKKAVDLIKGSANSMTEIAMAVGFGDYNHFGRQFKKYYGYVPSELRDYENSRIV